MNWTDPEVIGGLVLMVLAVAGAVAKLTPTTKDDEAIEELKDAAESTRPLWGLFKRKGKK